MEIIIETQNNFRLQESELDLGSEDIEIQQE
jgi:hypothetical protein